MVPTRGFTPTVGDSMVDASMVSKQAVGSVVDAVNVDATFNESSGNSLMEGLGGTASSVHGYTSHGWTFPSM